MNKFDEIEEQIIPNFCGGTGRLICKMYGDDLNRFLKGKLEPGSSIGLHTHETSSEILYVVSGTPKMITNGIEERLYPGAVSYCKKGNSHTLINDTDEMVEFFAVIPNQ